MNVAPPRGRSAQVGHEDERCIVQECPLNLDIVGLAFCRVLLQIGHLYTIERGLRQKRAGPRLREATRASQSRMIYERLHRVLTAWQSRGHILPQSSLGKAISYTLGQWASLAVYLQDGTIEIDNNLVENAIRPTAVGKN